MHFKAQKITNLAQAIFPDVVVKIGHNKLGDTCTCPLHFFHADFGEDILDVVGFSTSDYDLPADDCEIEILEMRTRSSDSAGGVQTSNEALAVFAARLQCRLRQEGFTVVSSLNAYF